MFRTKTASAFLICFVLMSAFSASAFAAATSSTQQALYTDEQLDQLVSPIALYSDNLLAQVLTASTYPLEIVEAERWYKSNSSLKGTQLENALTKQDWDPSVKSLVTTPQVLEMMGDQLDWTQDLGNAFLSQQADVMKAVQRLRAKAKAAGNLKSTPQQTVVYDQSSSTIVIQSPDPQVVYVPSYNPAVVYGTWAYPAYPPYSFYPYAGNAVSFGLGLAVGYAFWGDCDWHHDDINVNVNNYNRFNHTDIVDPHWHHDPYHRRGVGYQGAYAQQHYGNRDFNNERNRDAFRGHGPNAPMNGPRPGGLDNRPNMPANRAGIGNNVRPGGGAGGLQHNPPMPAHIPGGKEETRRPGGGDFRPGAAGGGMQHNAPMPSRIPGGGSGGGFKPGGSNGGGNTFRPNAFDGVGNGPSHFDSDRGHFSGGGGMPQHFGGGGTAPHVGGGVPHFGGGGGAHFGGGGGGGFMRRR